MSAETPSNAAWDTLDLCPRCGRIPFWAIQALFKPTVCLPLIRRCSRIFAKGKRLGFSRRPAKPPNRLLVNTSECMRVIYLATRHRTVVFGCPGPCGGILCPGADRHAGESEAEVSGLMVQVFVDDPEAPGRGSPTSFPEAIGEMNATRPSSSK